MIQAIKERKKRRHGKGIRPTLYLSETVLLGVHLKHVHIYMCDIEVAKMPVSVMTTTSSDGSLTTATLGSNQTVHDVAECSATHDTMP